MPYQLSDLGVFDVISDKSLLDGTNYFELHPKEVMASNACWLAGSVFIRDAGFDFFCVCFERSIPDFDYFAFARVVQPHLGHLAAELRTFLHQCRTTADRLILFSRYSSLFTVDIWDQVETEHLRRSIIAAGQNIERFVMAAGKDSGVLWVMGM